MNKTTSGAMDKTMRIRRMHVRSWLIVFAGVFFAGFVVVGCTAEQWEAMQNWGKPDAKDKRVTQGRRSTGRQREVGRSDAKVADGRSSRSGGTTEASSARAPVGDDDREKDVDDRVGRYVRSMDSRYDTSYQGNDFNDKIRRQQDPGRENRIRRTAEMNRRDSAGGESASKQDDRIPVSPEERRMASEASVAQGDTQRGTSGGEEPRMARGGDAQGTTGAETSDVKAVAADPVDDNEMHGEPIGGGRHGARTERVASTEPVAVEPSALTGDASSRVKVSSNEPVAIPAGLDDGASLKSSGPASGGAVKDEEKPSRPPVLTKIDVAAAPEAATEPQAVTVSPVVPSEPVDTFAKRLADQEALVAKDPNNLREQFTLRMMYLIDGQDDKALESQEGIDAELQAIMRAQIEAMMAARTTAGRDPATWATRQQEALKRLNELLESRADLRVPVVVLCRAIERYGNYEPIDPLVFPAGRRNLVLVYAEVENFRSEQTPSGKCRSLMSARLSLLNKTGEELWSTRTDNFEDYSMRPRRDFFFSYGPFAIPKTLPPGEFVLKVEVEDVLAGKINSNTVSFKMVVE